MYTKIISILIIIGLISSFTNISTAINTNTSPNSTLSLNETSNKTSNKTNNITNNNPNNTLTNNLLTTYSQGLETIYVSNKGNDNNTGENWNNAVATINTGVNYVKAGGTIILDDGIYYPPFSSISKGCTIKSKNGPTKTIITSFTFHNQLKILGGTDTVFNIEDISFQNCRGYYASALLIYTGILNCNNCIFNNCSGDTGGAISSYNEGDCVFSNCVFENCNVKNGGGVISNGGRLSCFNCNFNNNNALQGGGVIYNSGTVNFTSSQFQYNTATYGGVIYNVAPNNYYDSIFKSCDFIGNNATYGNIAYSNKSYNNLPVSSIIFNSSYFDHDTENNFAGNIININQILTKETNNNTTNNTTSQNNTNNTPLPAPIINQIIQTPYIYHQSYLTTIHPYHTITLTLPPKESTKKIMKIILLQNINTLTYSYY